VYTEDEKDQHLKDLVENADKTEQELEEAVKSMRGVDLQRYKGLGEMNAEELWSTTMDPDSRVLKQVQVEDGQAADHIFDTLMGKDVDARKSFIQSNAEVATIDL
jgi:DNA gyrase subunit B